MNGNAELCRLALKYGACLAVTNFSGQSIFKYDTPTKQLLFGLLGKITTIIIRKHIFLDNLESEPKWAEGDACSQCDAKFTLTMRKHHCRHCGRLVCKSCSERQIPIVKYNLQKNVRVCQICYEIITIGGASLM